MKVPTRFKKTVMTTEYFKQWLEAMKKKHGPDLLQWPPHARELYRSIEIKDEE